MPSRNLIVSLHDVAGDTFAKIKQQREELDVLGVGAVSLLVVPRYHGGNDLLKSSELQEWLRARVATGDEVVLHGWEHRVGGELGKGAGQNRWSRWFFENCYTANEAEFFNLDEPEAERRLGWGREMFDRAGLPFCGFIAPAWLMNDQVEEVLRKQGFLYSTTISKILNLQKGTSHPTRSCVWSTRAAWRRGCSLGWNALLFKRLQGVDPLRIGLHPGDLDHPAIWRQIKGMIQEACRDRHPCTYAEWVKNQSMVSKGV